MNGVFIDAVDDESGVVLPCDGRLAVDGTRRCGEPLAVDGSCSACGSVACEICGRVYRCVDFDFCEGACRPCVAGARDNFPPYTPVFGAAMLEALPLVGAFS